MGTPDTINTNHRIILFDGVCNLCSGAVLFVIKRDRQNRFLFASLQSSFGQEQLLKYSIKPGTLDSIILLEGPHYFLRSNAALEIARNLNGLWPVFYILKIIPRFIRDIFYDFISSNRYKLFGKKEACMIPGEELKSKFIDTV